MEQSQGQEENQSNERPGTPPRPPYSPVTPVFAHLAPVPGGNPIVPPDSSPSSSARPPQDGGVSSIFSGPPRQPLFAPEPPPVPISESENPDAIALRSAISILQLQKQQSLRDIQTLDKMKKAAAADPEGFAQELAAGNLTSSPAPGGIINFTDQEDDEESRGKGKVSEFGKIPPPQNIVRMPPINWAKYHIVGEPLDRIHEEQRRRPPSGEPRRQDPTQRAPEHVLAAPYRPLVDKLETPGKPRGTTSRGKKA